MPNAMKPAVLFIVTSLVLLGGLFSVSIPNGVDAVKKPGEETSWCWTHVTNGDQCYPKNSECKDAQPDDVFIAIQECHKVP